MASEKFICLENKEKEREYNSYKKQVKKSTPYERTREQVYATGNKWAIENFNATHN